MVKNKKTLLTILVLLFSISLYAQKSSEVSSGNENSSQTVILDDYFSSSSSETNQNELTTGSTIGVFVKMIVVLLIVIILIYSVFYFIKKKSNVVKDEDDFLRRAAYLNIAPGKTVEVITLIDKAYLIGVTEDSISMLGEIDDKELIQAMNLNADKKQNISKATNFAEVLEMFMGGKNKKVNVYKDSENKLNNFLNRK